MGLSALCPGTFDPVTNGHLDIVRRAAVLFDPLVVAVLENPGKAPVFPPEERVAMLKEAVADLPNVEVSTFSGLLVELAARRDIRVIVKGVRAARRAVLRRPIINPSQSAKLVRLESSFPLFGSINCLVRAE